MGCATGELGVGSVCVSGCDGAATGLGGRAGSSEAGSAAPSSVAGVSGAETAGNACFWGALCWKGWREGCSSPSQRSSLSLLKYTVNKRSSVFPYPGVNR